MDALSTGFVPFEHRLFIVTTKHEVEIMNGTQLQLGVEVSDWQIDQLMEGKSIELSTFIGTATVEPK